MKIRGEIHSVTTVGVTEFKPNTVLIRTVSFFILMAVLLLQTVSFGDVLPGFRAPLLTEPTSPDDFNNVGGSNSSGPSISDPEIKALARGLKYDPGLMYKFVHDHIQFEPSWGELKGPYMTWMDRSGNGFDQASLMIALLKEAEQNCTEYTVEDPNYVIGEIQLTADQAMSWFNLGYDPNMARQVLARGGLYGSVSESGGDISSLNMIHIWVTVTIDGNEYEFDPSFKTHDKTNGLGLGELEEAMGYETVDQIEFIEDANDGSSSGSNWDKDVNKADIIEHLTEYTSNLIEELKDNYYSSDLEDIIGGLRIEPVDANALPPDSLSYTVISRDDEFPIDNMPERYRTTLRILHEGIDETFFSSDIYGRRLTLNYNGSNQPQILLDGVVQETGDATTLGNSYDLTISVDHPYYVDDFDAATTIKVIAGGLYQIVNGWGNTGTKIIQKHRGELQQCLYNDLDDDSEEVLGESYAIVGFNWLAQTSRMRAMAATQLCSHAKIVNHHMLGITGQYESPYIDIPLGHLGVYDYEDANAVFLTVTNHASAYEHSIIRQLNDCNAVSTMNLLDMANDRSTYDKIYAADDNNWNSVQSNLNSYSQDANDLAYEYVNAGYTLHLPQYGNIGDDDWSGTGFQAILSTSDSITASYIISGGYSGGSAEANEPLDPSQLLENSEVVGSDSGAAYSCSPTDLSIGGSSFPYGLSFSRQYSSHRRLEDGPLGLGWTHNYNITAKVQSDSWQILSDSPVDAAPHIVSLYITHEIMDYNYSSLRYNIISSICQSWLMDQMQNNLVTIDQGGSKMRIVKDPNGTYNAGSMRLVKQGNGNFRLKNNKGIFYDFDSDGRMSQWSDAHGNTVDYTYDDNNLDTVTTKIGGTEARWISFTYDANDHITDVNDSAGRGISYTYDSNDNLTGYTNLDGYEYLYDYDDVNDGQLTKAYLPTDQNNPYVTNVYDCLGQLIQRIDANDSTWDFYYATYRTETLEPNQVDPNGLTKRFSVIRWANPDNHVVTSTDRLGRQTTNTFDGELRITVTPSGTQIESQHDMNGNLSNLTFVPTSGSSDPNIVTSRNYEEYGNPEDPNDRWFIITKRTVGASGNITYYQYDFNDVQAYGSDVGNLMKITYPEVDTPNGKETPIVTFKYNSYGQLTRKTDPNGMETSYEYYLAAAGAGLKKTIVDCNGTSPLNITTEVTYDDVGRVISSEDPLGNITQKEYYDSGLLKKIITPAADSNEITYEYYQDGRLQHVKQQTTNEGLVYLQSVTYNSRRLKKTVCGPYNSTSDSNINLITYYYDGLGRPWKIKNAEDNITETRYYPDGKVWKVIDAEGHDTVTYTYDPNNGNLLKVEDANDNATEYEYNGSMRKNKIIYADGTFETATYDNYGRSAQRTTRAGDEISVTYDELNRVKQKTTPDKTIEYVYDITGRLAEISEVWSGTSDKETTTNTYDDVGQLIRIDYPGGRSVAYECDLAGNRTRLTYPNNDYITYEYDNLYRPTKIRDDANNVLAEYTYDERSRREELEYANGTGIEYAYDVASRLLSINNITNSGQLKYEYTYDKVGNRLTMLVNDIDEHKYTYDDIYQVTDVNYPVGYESLAYDTTFNYDDVGNRTSVINNGTIYYTTNELNQYTTFDEFWFDYDQNGNLTYDGKGNFSYDSENRLAEAVNASGSYSDQLNIALDNTDIVFTTGGAANWVYTTTEYSDANDGDSAHSTELADANSWLVATVYGKGTVKFYQKVTNGSFYFMIDDTIKHYGGGNWEQYSYNISTVGKHELKWYFSVPEAETGNAWVDKMEWNLGSAYNYSYALDTDWDVYTTDVNGWRPENSPSYYGGYSMENGNISDDESSQMEVFVKGEGDISFYWKVSSEADSDYLKFYIDGELQDSNSGTVDWVLKSYSLSGAQTHSLLWEYVKDGSGSSGSDCGWVDYLQTSCTTPYESDELAEAVDSDLSYTNTGDRNWSRGQGNSDEFYYEGDSAHSSISLDDDEASIMETTVEGEGIVKFYWKVSSELNNDYLEFYIDDEDPSEGGNKISGEVDWQLKTFEVTGSGTHTLKWQYIKDSSGEDGNDCGWVDYVQWTGLSEGPDPNQWDTAEYEYDPSGRRIKKKVNGYSTRYVYDGDHVIAEYDGNHNLLRKFVYGPGVDQPVCMIDVIDSNEPYYYHFDGLGSVMALSDANGVIAEQYAYDIFGQTAIVAPDDWYNHNWDYRKKITIQNDYVDSNLADFPLYVKIDSDPNIGAHAQTDGNDIRLTLSDGKTVIPYEKEAFAIDGGSATGHFWVKVPTVASGSTTDIYMYYGNSEASNGEDTANVWNDNYLGVWHLSEDSWDGTSGEVKDSTSNENNGTGSGNTDTFTGGKIGRGGDFPGGGDDFVNLPAIALGGNTGSFSLWAYPDPLTGSRAAFGKCWFGHSIFARNYGTTENPDWRWLGEWNGNYFIGSSDSAIDQTWQHIAVTYDGSLGSNNLKLYVNESLEAQDDETDDNTNENRAWQIGAHGNSAYEWIGDIDEVRLYKETLSADWIKFEYYNISEADNELTWSAEEETPEASQPSELIGNPYMFTGRRFDLETGLYYYRARYYDPNIGRFLQTDPIGYGDGINWYNYCGNNPASWMDPSGCWPEAPSEEWIEKARDTYFMIFIDASGSMGGIGDEEVEKIIFAAEALKYYLLDYVYIDDLVAADDHVKWRKILKDDTAEQGLLGHETDIAERWLWGLQEFNHEDPDASRYVNLYFTNESDKTEDGHGYYSDGSQYALDEIDPHSPFDEDYYDMVEELRYRTFSVGKVFNLGLDENGAAIETGCHPGFLKHLEAAFEGKGDYGQLYENGGYTLQEMGISYENVKAKNSWEDYLDYMVHSLDSPNAYIRE